MTLNSPAKVNLYLKVVRRMDDGYHQINTLFERISIFDNITIEKASEYTTIDCTDPQIPSGEDSLIGRAIKSFKAESGKDFNFKIKIEKNIPVSAGLGGGSSNAATILNGINEITGYPLKEENLLEIASKLGADIPFFLKKCRFASGVGRGDIIQEIESPVSLWHVLVNPPFNISTKDIYEKVSAFGLTKNNGIDRMFSTFLKGENIRDVAGNLHNDLQHIVLEEFPVLKHVFSSLMEAGAKGVLLSGSGPTVFGIFERDNVLGAADKMRQIFPEKDDWRIFVAQTF